MADNDRAKRGDMYEDSTCAPLKYAMESILDKEFLGMTD